MYIYQNFIINIYINNYNCVIIVKIFLKLTKAYEVLSDPKKKREYDEKLKAKLHQKERIQKFDAKRRQMKEGI